MYRKILLIFLAIATTTSALTDDKMTLGLEVFNNKAQCGLCHILQAANSEGKIGPNLDLLKPQLKQIIYTVSNGIGVMPAYEEILTDDEIKAVALYVFNSTNN